MLLLLLLMLVKDTLRQIRRRKLRSLIIIFVLALGIGMSTIVDNMNASLQATFENYYTKYNLPDITVWGNKTYLNENLTQELTAHIPGVRYVEPEVYLFGWAFLNNITYQVRIRGLSLDSPLLNISKGKIKDFSGNKSIFVEKNTDEKYDTGIQIGDTLEILYSTAHGGTITNLTVNGFVNAPWAVPGQAYPEVIVGFMEITALQQMLNMTGKVMDLQIYVKSGYNITKTFEQIKAYIETHYNITIEGHIKNAGDTSFSSVSNTFFSLISWPSMLIASILLAAGLIQSIFEDTRQIGIRKALGFTNRQLIAYYVIIGVLLYGIGSILGVVMSYVTSYLALGLIDKIFGGVVFVVDYQALIRNTLIGFVIALLASIVPSFHVTKINPIYAIKYGIEKLNFKKGNASKVTNYPLSVRLAWKNISRRKKRGAILISILVLANVSTFGLTFFAVSLVDTYNTAINDVYQWDISVNFEHPVNSTVFNQIREISGVERVEGGNSITIRYKTLKIFVGSECRLSKAYRTLTLSGINASGTLVKPLIIKGTGLSDYSDGIIVTTNIAKKLNIDVGDTLRIVGKTYGDYYINATFSVIGISVEILNDGWIFYVSSGRLSEVANITKGSYYNLYAKVKEGYGPDSVLKEITNKFAECGISFLTTKKQLLVAINNILPVFTTFIYLLVGIINAVTFAGIFAVLYLMVYERKRDIAILKSIGATKTNILKMALTEISLLATLIVAVSVIPAMGLSNFLIDELTRTGIDLVIIPTTNLFIYSLLPLHALGVLLCGYALPLRTLLYEKAATIFKEII